MSHLSPSHTSTKTIKTNKTHEIHETLKRTSPHLDHNTRLKPPIAKKIHNYDTKFHSPVNYGGISIAQITLLCFVMTIIFGVMCVAIFFLEQMSKTIFTSDYTLCKKVGSNVTCQSQISPKMSFNKPMDDSCHCQLRFELKSDLYVQQINIYYGLNDFHQNYRFLAQSKSDIQLHGDIDYTPKDNCFPNLGANNNTIVPCGALANIMFDDEFSLSKDNSSIVLDRFDIAFDGSRGYQFKNPKELIRANGYSRPPRWTRDMSNLDPNDQRNNGFENGPLIVWLDVATFADFAKLYSIFKPYGGVLRKGEYNVDINYRFGTHQSNLARKSISIETLGTHGISNSRLMLVIFALSLEYFILFVVIFLVWRRWAYLAQVLYHAP